MDCGNVMREDNWTVATESGARSAQFEQTVIVTDNGVEILTVVVVMTFKHMAF